MPNIEQQAIEVSTLSRIEAAVGSRFLAYLLVCDADNVNAMIAGSVPPSKKQAEALHQLVSVLKTVPAELDTARIDHAIRHWLATPESDGKSVVRRVREYIAGPETTLEVEGELEQAIATLAVDAYPTLLLTPDERVPVMPYSVMLAVISANHPEKTRFCNGVLLDPILKHVFTREGEHTDYSGMLLANTGSSGSIQLAMLPEVLLQTAWQKLEGVEVSPQEFAARTVDELEFARAVVSGRTRTIAAKVAFTGVLVPKGVRLDLGDGDFVREVTEADRQFMSPDTAGKMSQTDSSGRTITINYDGDIVLVHRFPYRVRIARADEDLPRAWFHDPTPHAVLQRVVMRLRFSLMLAVERERRVQIVEAWRNFDQPLSQGWSMGLADPRRSTGLNPTQLTDAEIKAWGEWYQRLNTPHVDRIEVALTRVLRATSERREPSDLLIDSVIAWENLFGSPKGETTLRVTTCLALLLEDSLEARKVCKKRLGAIYRLRSKIVHGNDNLGRAEYPMCFDALDVSIQAIRMLVTERTDILELPDGSLRSNALLLGA